MEGQVDLGPLRERVFLLKDITVLRGDRHLVDVVVAAMIDLTATERRPRRRTGRRRGHLCLARGSSLLAPRRSPVLGDGVLVLTAIHVRRHMSRSRVPLLCRIFSLSAVHCPDDYSSRIIVVRSGNVRRSGTGLKKRKEYVSRSSPRVLHLFISRINVFLFAETCGFGSVYLSESRAKNTTAWRELSLIG